ncbi:MAG: T9SS type A sorting domain-containing protein [Candidatus Eisenbacteria bacterium]
MAMEPVAFLRRTALGLLGTALGAALLVVAAHGSELPAASDASGLTLHGPDETLRDYCVAQDGRLWLVLPDGARYELVTSTADEAIANAGDGSFHPFEETQVRAALAAVRYPIGSVSADVFLLPYPRRDGLESAAGPRLILLSPGVRPLTPEHQHAEFIHELGHVVQYARMPDADTDAWTHYREIRGITDVSVYNATAPHADRPHEIFAEDFRALFGGSLANYSGTIENPNLAAPATVAGLSDFMRDLAGVAGPWVSRALACYPNPSIDVVSFARAGGAAVPLEVYDLAGRRVATLQPVAAGVFFARARDGNGALRVTRVR